MRHILWKGMKWSLAALGSLLALCLILVGTLFFIMQTSFGQQKFLAFVLPKIQTQLQGQLRIGEFHTDLLHRIEFRQIEVKDSEGEIAIAIERFEVNYTLPSLLQKIVHITSLSIENGFVQARYLENGTLNLVSLVKTEPQQKSSSPLPLKIQIDQIHIEMNGQADLKKQSPLERSPEDSVSSNAPSAALSHAKIHLELWGKFFLAGEQFEIDDVNLNAHLFEPAAVDMKMVGSFTKQNQTMIIHQLAYQMTTRAEEVAHFMPQIKLQGPVKILLYADGPFDQLKTSFILNLPTGLFQAEGMVNLKDPQLPWQLKISAKGVDLFSLNPEISEKDTNIRRKLSKHPRTFRFPSLLKFELEGRGEKTNGFITLKQFSFETLNSKLLLQGSADFQDGAVRRGQIDLDFHSQDLRTLRQLGLPKISGWIDAHLSAKKTDSQVLIDTEIKVDKFRMQKMALDAATFTAHTKNLIGTIHLQVKQLAIAQFVIHHLALRAQGDPKKILLQINAFGSQQTRLALRLHGTPIEIPPSEKKEEKLLTLPKGLRLILTEFWVSRFAKSLTIVKPVEILVESLSAPNIAIHPMLLETSFGRLNLSGQYETQKSWILAEANFMQLDLQGAAIFAVGKGENVPKTNLNVDAHFQGSLLHPNIGLRLQGESAPFSQLPAVTYQLQVELSQQKIAGTIGLRAFPRSLLSLPKSDSFKPGKLLARANLFSNRELLGELNLSFSSKHPWDLAKGSDWSDGVFKHPIIAELELGRVRVDKLLQIVHPGAPLLDKGILSGKIFWEGAIENPRVKVEIELEGLTSSKFSKFSTDVSLKMHYDRNQLHASLGSKINSSPFAFAKLDTEFNLFQLIWSHVHGWKEIPMQGSVIVFPYELNEISQVHGQVQALCSVQGTISNPRGKLYILGENLGVEDWDFGTLQADLNYQDGKIKAEVNAKQDQGHFLKLNAQIPLPFHLQATSFHLLAKEFTLNYLPKVSPDHGLRTLQGVINADLELNGLSSTSVPLQGFFRLGQGAFGITTDPRLYRDIELALRFEQTGDIYLERFVGAAEVGSFSAVGHAKLDGLKLTQANLDFESRHFPVSGGSFGFWVNAKLQAKAQATKAGLQVDISIPSGSIELPKLASAKNVQPIESLDEVHYHDAEARKKEEAASSPSAFTSSTKKQKETPLFGLGSMNGQINLPGPFLVQGPEVDATLEGNLSIKGSQMTALQLSGLVRAITGHVEIMDQRYTIERAQVSLDGSIPPNPLIDVLLSRQLKNGTTIFIGVLGTPKNPKLILRSDPPDYDQGQIIQILLTGDPKDGEGSSPDLGNRALGMLSGLILNKLKNRLAEILPIDVLKIETGGSEVGGLSDTKIEIGKYILKNLYVGVSYQFGNVSFSLRPQNREEVRVEYQFLRNMKFSQRFRFLQNLELDTRFGEAGVGSIDLFFNWRF